MIFTCPSGTQADTMRLTPGRAPAWSPYAAYVQFAEIEVFGNTVNEILISDPVQYHDGIHQILVELNVARIVVSTGVTYTGDISVTGLPFVLIEFKAFYDANLLLTSDNGSVFEIAIGGSHNTKSEIRDAQQGNVLVSKNGEVLNGNQWTLFKLSWGGTDLILETFVGYEEYSNWMTLPNWRNFSSMHGVIW